MSVTRRIFMIGGATLGGGILLGIAGIGVHLATHNRLETQRRSNRQQDQVNLWIRITRDNEIVVICPHTDMGQGSATGLMQIVAEEIDADWTQMRVEQAPADTVYSNGKVIEGFVSEMITPPDWATTLMETAFYRLGDIMKIQMTGGSTAIRFTGWQAMRHAAAATRQMLITVAADRLGVQASQLRTEQGRVVHNESARSLTYGELATDVLTAELPDIPSLKDASNRLIVGKPLAREDLPGKVFADPIYAIDADVAGMHYAAVLNADAVGTQFAAVENADEITSRRGVSDVLMVPRGIAVLADNPWRAEQAVRALRVTRKAHENSQLDSETAEQRQRDALNGDLVSGVSVGEPQNIEPTIKAEYFVPYLAHATMEPMNATVWQEDGRLHVIAGLQNPLMARARVAETAGLKLEDVVLHPRKMGGGFGRRVSFSMTSDEPLDWLVQAVHIAIDSGKAVKTSWSRETDMRSDVYRPMVLAQFEGALADSGKPVLWRSRSFGKEQNKKAVAPPYDIANQDILFADKEHPVPVGFWRSVEHSQHGFFVESFIDELALAANEDPLQYRLDLLPETSAHAAVLHKVGEMSGWRRGVDDQGRALGVAMVHSFGSTIAQVVEASPATDASEPVVHRVWCAVDCGIAINPQMIEAQIQGSVHFALSAALYGKCDLKDGAVVQSNFHDYRMVSLRNAPRVEVAIVDTGSPVGGIGEVGVPPLAPALCNALAGVKQPRQRRLPLLS